MSDEIHEILKIPDLPVIEIVDDLVQVFKEFMVVNAALKLDLFSWLAENGPATPEKLATGTGIRAEYVTSLLGMLYYLDMVRKAGDEFSISPAARMNFVRNSPFYQGDYIMNLPADDSPWKDLAVYLTKPEQKTTFDTSSLQAVRSEANHALRGTIQSVTNVLKTWDRFSDAKKFLEMNGGHGLYAIAACQNNPQMTATVLTGSADPSVAKEYVVRFGMEDRIRVLPGDLSVYTDQGCDIILIAHALYSMIDRLDDVLSKVSSILTPNGLLISNHWFSRPPIGTGMQGLYELELAIHNHYHELPDKELFESLCLKHNLPILQAGVIRSRYGESTIHMAEKK
ncbi:hypothetical protein Mhun_1991 [Methanospirillum hungatei JF-1]|jgi:predicted O-methyltransferase YrrM|uniref:O-methyltransferase dimerisation domain-containing protein n=1 Tax=Methanospirillum hungatei JF-1 (strain ATCC 27890 / DSM 864 / NBRC 100397 / JF-1) TaxID=323259 RepID=Q2FRL7_METHJ|nr:hypothetical protein [Methanospirillum hungatei]ABD41701.1 hypothetical protein Mhun_1991 [Methanospirillum hungatei JF-1]MBP9007285.1 hypothetical protein [Methanospirillum sp.]OQA58426.1 MAG: hypothetical protein BWY45_01211 [Euryarchaeota archaeon ADurb.Bin294]HOW03975.1 hypothetical protein [Methanospirillum hungatei]